MFINQGDITLNNDQRNGALRDLELFRMLLQPHFLFNSLNNLYALSIKQSDQTSDAIAGLSGLLSKVVNCSRKEYITLQEEVELIEDYLDLERIWLGEAGFLMDYQVKGNAQEFLLPPLVLYTFVENCFKHGVRKCRGERWVTIRIEVRHGMLRFLARNSVPECDEEPGEGMRSANSGLGITAARKLLEQKCSKGYRLSCGRKEKVYETELIINCIKNISPDKKVQVRRINGSQARELK